MNEIKRLWRAARYSFDGLKRAYADEAAFRLEARLSVAIVPTAFILGDTPFDRAILLGAWILVPMVELLNSGLEAITDYATHKQQHDLAKKTKDVGSAAVLLAAIIFGVTWIGYLL